MGRKRSTAKPAATNLTLRHLRELAGLSEKELALRLGHPNPFRLSRTETGHKELSFTELEAISAAMGQPAGLLHEVYLAVQHSRLAQSVGAGDSRGQAGPYSPAAEEDSIVAEFQAAHGEALRKLIHRIVLAVWTRFDRALAVKLWKMLRSWPPEDRLETIREDELFQSWSLCELLCQESLRAAGDDVGQALALAELAEQIAECIPGVEEWRKRVRGYCGFHVANAWRVQGELKTARQLCERARKLWEAGSELDSEVLDPARVLGLQATLLRSERKLEESLQLCEEALRLRSTRERPYILLAKSISSQELGWYEDALAALTEAQGMIPADDIHLQYLSSFKQAVLNCHLEQYLEASALIPQIHTLVDELDEQLSRIRLTWLEGRVARGLGQHELAILAFRSAREELAERHLFYDQALVTLELAEVLATTERHWEVKDLAASLVPIFQEQEVHREALSALRLFYEATEREALTVELAQQLIHYLYRAQYNPGLEFQTP